QPNWPDIEYREFIGGPNYGYLAHKKASKESAHFLTSAWMKENVSDRGPLGALYRVWGDGKQMVPGDKVDYFGLAGYTDEELKQMGYVVWLSVQPKGSWLGETDNITFMNMLGNGLRAYEIGSYGGWGGRVPTPAPSAGVPPQHQPLPQGREEFPDFFPQAQRDFANRLTWSVTDTYSDANHEPEVGIMGPLHLLASPGQTIKLHGFVSDPDGDNLSVKWWQFQVGTYPGTVDISHANSLKAEVLIPEDALGGQSIHLILAVTDDGTPSLTRYQRVIVTVKAE
ncbi:MAG: nucleoside hydrolase-like domain-containing protein, partial [Bacteroidota bacterium]